MSRRELHRSKEIEIQPDHDAKSAEEESPMPSRLPREVLKEVHLLLAQLALKTLVEARRSARTMGQR